jgi:hypothetical protein
MNGAKYVSNSGNTKIMGSAKIDATYLSILVTCPETCLLKKNGCYADNYPLGLHVHRLNDEAVNLSPIQVARAEAFVIDNSYNAGPVPTGRALRMHVSGESRTITGSRIINAAVGRWKARGGGIAFSYTHAWDHVTKEHWTNVSMLASVDSLDQVEYARQNGYAPAIVVAEHKSDKAYRMDGCSTKWIPCPAQVNKVGCVDCKICLNADRLYHNDMGVAFAAHGIKTESIKKRLQVLK